MNSLLHSMMLVGLGLASTAAFAQNERDLPDDPLLGAMPEPTVAEEKSALKNEEALSLALPEEKRRRRIIQTLQRKKFMKLGRYEISPHVGFVTSDKYLNRYIGGAILGYHVTEVLSVEAFGGYSPNLGDADFKPVTIQIRDENGVVPGLSRIMWYAGADMAFSPIYGKVALGSNKIVIFDLYGLVGAGVVNTADDIVALQKTNDELANSTANQIHPTLNYGGGLRIALSEGFALKLETRGLSYVEVLEATSLEMKNNLTLLAGASFFFPGMK